MNYETCARCDRRVTDEIWCSRHYKAYQNEWACACGWMNSTKKCERCGIELAS